MSLEPQWTKTEPKSLSLPTTLAASFPGMVALPQRLGLRRAPGLEDLLISSDFMDVHGMVTLW